MLYYRPADVSSGIKAPYEGWDGQRMKNYLS